MELVELAHLLSVALLLWCFRQLHVFLPLLHNAKLRKISKLKKEVNEAKANYQQVKSENTFNTTQSQLSKRLESEGLKINTQSPIVIDPET